MAGRARSGIYRAPTSDDLRACAFRGYGGASVAFARTIAAELLDWREGRLPAPPAGVSDEDYRAAIEAL